MQVSAQCSLIVVKIFYSLVTVTCSADNWLRYSGITYPQFNPQTNQVESLCNRVSYSYRY